MKGSEKIHLAVLWPLLQTLLTEVLHKADWLRLWDHLMSRWTEPELLHTAAVAFLRCIRAKLLVLKPNDLKGVETLLRTSQHVHMTTLLEMAEVLRQSFGKLDEMSGVLADVLMADTTGLLASDGLGGSPSLPLPVGLAYPEFKAYP